MKIKRNTIIMHRGSHDNKKIPENSLAAFQKAIEEGHGIELDVHLLKDNTIVVFHDDNTIRMTGVDQPLKEFSYKEIKKLNLLNTNEKIPTLKEVLDLVKGKVFLDIEVKTDQRVGCLERELLKYLDHYPGPFSVKSFYPSHVYWLKKHRPNYETGLLIDHNWTHIFTLNGVFLKILKPDFLSVDIRLLPNQKVMRFRRHGKISLWTIQTQKQLEQHQNQGDCFIVEGRW